MSRDNATPNSTAVTRRTFPANTSVTLLGSAVLPMLYSVNSARAAGAEPLKIALIGCGKRGSGAANQALSTEGQTKLVAMADVSPDQITGSALGTYNGALGAAARALQQWKPKR